MQDASHGKDLATNFTNFRLNSWNSWQKHFRVPADYRLPNISGKPQLDKSTSFRLRTI